MEWPKAKDLLLRDFSYGTIWIYSITSISMIQCENVYMHNYLCKNWLEYIFQRVWFVLRWQRCADRDTDASSTQTLNGLSVLTVRVACLLFVPDCAVFWLCFDCFDCACNPTVSWFREHFYNTIFPRYRELDVCWGGGHVSMGPALSYQPKHTAASVCDLRL